MHRSAFSQLPKPHELFSTAALNPGDASPSSRSHSRSRNRSSGGSSASQGSLLVDTSDENDVNISRFRESRSKSGGRSSPPVTDDPDGLLVPMHNWHDSNGQRVPSPYPQSDHEIERERLLGAATGELRIGEGSSGQRWMSWLHNGKLGDWLWNTQKGWVVYVVLLITLYAATSLILLIMNRFILWSKSYMSVF
jgi:hypothetical protein